MPLGHAIINALAFFQEFLRRHEELTGEKYSLEVLGYPPEEADDGQPNTGAAAAAAATAPAAASTANKRSSAVANPFKPKPPPIPIANQVGTIKSKSLKMSLFITYCQLCMVMGNSAVLTVGLSGAELETMAKIIWVKK